MSIAEYKKKIVNDIVNLAKQYPIIGLVNMENLPAPQLQAMRSELRGKIELFMTKKRFMRVALEKVKEEKKGMDKFSEYFEGMPALIFTKENPFKLSKMLQKSKTKAPAKAGQTAPDDIIIKKGPTPFAPGPIISELSEVGLKVGVEAGKVAVKEDSVIVKKGEKIKPKVAEILTRLDIKPMVVGLGLVVAYEDGIFYEKDVLDVDEEAFNQKINLAALQAFNLAFHISYTTKDNIIQLISKAFNDAKGLGISQEIFDKGIIENLLGNAENSMISLKNTANIETAKPREEVKEEPKQEVKKDISKPEIKEHPKPEVKIEELKPEPKKEIPAPEIKKEPALEKLEQPIQPLPEVKEEQKEIKDKETDMKVQKMVENVKKYIEGNKDTAADIIEAVKKEQVQEKKEEEQKISEKLEQPKQQPVPDAHDLKQQKESEQKLKEKKEQKEIEDLTKELIKKGTLRKK